MRNYSRPSRPFSNHNHRSYHKQPPQQQDISIRENGAKKQKENHPLEIQKTKTPQELSYLSEYQLGKYYENNITCRNLEKALEHYRQAFRNGEKRDTTIKDLSGVLHQMGKTEQAIEFLNENKKIYRGDRVKYQNLIDNLKKQVDLPSGKSMNKFILILSLPRQSTQSDYKALFTNANRILNVKIYKDLGFKELATENDLPYGLVQFPSFSAAKKTLQSFKFQQNPYAELYWVNVNRLLICQIRKGQDDPFQLNNCYFGTNSGFDRFFNFVDSPPPCFQESYRQVNLYTESEFKKKDIRKLWSSAPLPSSPVISHRLCFQNTVKLQLIRRKKHRLSISLPLKLQITSQSKSQLQFQSQAQYQSITQTKIDDGVI